MRADRQTESSAGHWFACVSPYVHWRRCLLSGLFYTYLYSITETIQTLPVIISHSLTGTTALLLRGKLQRLLSVSMGHNHHQCRDMKYLIVHLIAFSFPPPPTTASLLLSSCQGGFSVPAAAGGAVPTGPNGAFLQKHGAFLQLSMCLTWGMALLPSRGC